MGRRAILGGDEKGQVPRALRVYRKEKTKRKEWKDCTYIGTYQVSVKYTNTVANQWS